MKNFEKKLIKILSQVLKVKESKINKKTNHNDIESWDSLQQLNLISALEVEFDIEISVEEASEMLSYKIISQIIKEKIKND